MYNVHIGLLSDIPFLKITDYSILFDVSQLKLAFVPKFILNDPNVKLYDGITSYSFEEGMNLFYDKDDLCYTIRPYGRCIQNLRLPSVCNYTIYSVEDLDKVTTKFIKVNNFKIEVRTGFGTKQYLWGKQVLFSVEKKYDWNVLTYRNSMYNFNFNDGGALSLLISNLYRIKDSICFDYISHHIKNNVGLNLTRDLCDYEVIYGFLRALLINRHSNHDNICKVVKDQIYSWFNLLLEFEGTYSNKDLFSVLIFAAWFAKEDFNTWDYLLKVLKYGKIPHKILNNSNGYAVEVFYWTGTPLLNFSSNNTSSYFKNKTAERYDLWWFYQNLWGLCLNRPKETSELFDDAGA